MSSKKELTERDICTKYINPALTQAGWNLQTQIREEVYFTDGKIYVKGNKSKRAKGKKADYILYYKPNIPVAIIEAKDNNHRVQDGIQQGLEYANILDIPVVFSSNGDEFYEHDKTLSNGVVERKISLNNFPTPDELWERYKKYKKIETQEEEKIISQDYFFDAQGRFPRYYQQIAINRTVEAIAKGQNRILLVMATGTGKTYTAFQIIHRLWKSGAKKTAKTSTEKQAIATEAQRPVDDPFNGTSTPSPSPSPSPLTTTTTNGGGAPKVFRPPTVDEVAAYCRQRGNKIDPEYFVDRNTATGWMYGKTRMRDWKAVVRTWERNDKTAAVHSGGRPRAQSVRDVLIIQNEEIARVLNEDERRKQLDRERCETSGVLLEHTVPGGRICQ